RIEESKTFCSLYVTRRRNSFVNNYCSSSTSLFRGLGRCSNEKRTLLYRSTNYSSVVQYQTITRRIVNMVRENRSLLRLFKICRHWIYQRKIMESVSTRRFCYYSNRRNYSYCFS